MKYRHVLNVQNHYFLKYGQKRECRYSVLLGLGLGLVGRLQTSREAFSLKLVWIDDSHICFNLVEAFSKKSHG